MSGVSPSCVQFKDTVDEDLTNHDSQYIIIHVLWNVYMSQWSCVLELCCNTCISTMSVESYLIVSGMCSTMHAPTDTHTVEHSYNLVLMVDIGSCLQQSLDCLGVSFRSSYPQRNTAILYESMRDKRTVIASGDHCCRTERECSACLSAAEEREKNQYQGRN